MLFAAVGIGQFSKSENFQVRMFDSIYYESYVARYTSISRISLMIHAHPPYLSLISRISLSLISLTSQAYQK